MLTSNSLIQKCYYVDQHKHAGIIKSCKTYMKNAFKMERNKHIWVQFLVKTYEAGKKRKENEKRMQQFQLRSLVIF